MKLYYIVCEIAPLNFRKTDKRTYYTMQVFASSVKDAEIAVANLVADHGYCVFRMGVSSTKTAALICEKYGITPCRFRTWDDVDRFFLRGGC